MEVGAAFVWVWNSTRAQNLREAERALGAFSRHHLAGLTVPGCFAGHVLYRQSPPRRGPISLWASMARSEA